MTTPTTSVPATTSMSTTAPGGTTTTTRRPSWSTTSTKSGQPTEPALRPAEILPRLAEIQGLAGDRADGSVVLAGSRVEESLRQISQPSPRLREWTGFVPMVVH